MITEKKLIEKGYKKHTNTGFGEHTHFFQKELCEDTYVNFNYFDFTNIAVPFDYQFGSNCQFELINSEHVNIEYLCGGDDIEIEEVEEFYAKFHTEFCCE